MYYISTRNNKDKYTFEEILLKGLADDGGLFIPNEVPTISQSDMQDILVMDYKSIAIRLIKLFTQDTFSDDLLEKMVHEAYESFNNNKITPLINLDENTSILELYHGPTLAFKDIAMQLLSRMIEEVLSKNNSRASIICATSGDTGGAAVASFADKENIDLYVLFPKDKISEVQRRFMSTSQANNINIISIDGNFDDCQNIVKSLFKDKAFSQSVHLTAVNSINWARIMIQIIYYFSAISQNPKYKKNPDIIVPTGNFGDIYAGYIAKKMGLEMGKLVIATNVNNILERCLNTGRYNILEAIQTNSPSMDIQISSNFERLLYDLVNQDIKRLSQMMDELVTRGEFSLNEEELLNLNTTFEAGSIEQIETIDIIKKIYDQHNLILDPHTAVAIGVSNKNNYTNSIILSTAHPAKFPEAVREAIGIEAELPANNKNIFNLPEDIKNMKNDISLIKNNILSNFRR
ncbi:MAG: threonine synthase [Hyphomicrobiales bacterium]|jgi:threonine synthase|nr:threonine synthase [Hyphomicrobiales bacterium]|tara:strand:- start:1574 stop:2959 length:1386 start_codon:yes stop_codon:yes gene_type:complete